MKVGVDMRGRAVSWVAGFSTLLFASAAIAETSCGVCEEQVVINSDLASCFLENYSELAGRAGSAVLVDLTECANSRSIIAAIPGPTTPGEEPSIQFMLSREQLDCLKKKLEEPGLVLDPSARIDLGTCG